MSRVFTRSPKGIKTIVVRNLPPIDKDDICTMLHTLLKIFENCGNIDSMYIPRNLETSDSNYIMKGIAIIRFSDTISAEYAYNNTYHIDR
jgi:hypothetical protein